MKLYIYKMLKMIFYVMLAAVLVASLKGHLGNPTATDLANPTWTSDGPFELSPERGRFGLMYSLIEDRSFYFSLPIARFIIPDLGYKNGHYVSLFAPGVSFLIIPGYLIGKLVGASQLGATFVISLFALINVLFISHISKRLGASSIAAMIAGTVFLFSTPAYAYAVSIYQHHISTFLILMSIYLFMVSSSLVSRCIIWFLFAASIPVDYPNLFLMIPIAWYTAWEFFEISVRNSMYTITTYVAKIGATTGVIIPLIFFMWFNFHSYGNAFQFSGTVPGVHEIGADGRPTAPKNADTLLLEKYFQPDLQKKSTNTFFKPRKFVNGLYILLFSPDRGIIYFAPVILFGIIGLVLLYKTNPTISVMLSGIVGFNIVLYSMWGDPWGGWAFGARYLIPSYAVLSIGTAYALTCWNRKVLFLLLFFVIATYGVFVNTSGALTTIAMPPQVEVLNLEKLTGREQKYTYQRNIDMLRQNNSKSVLFTTYVHTVMNAWTYYRIIAGIIITLVAALLIGLLFVKI